jgi:D-serine deaminase-like pyridoxal phosphate-dependent protein
LPGCANHKHPLIGMMEQITRPLLVVDEARCRANIRRMQEKAGACGARLRPHFKTHQSLEIGRWFREEGVDAIAVSSVSMARFFAGDGWKDIMIAFPVNFREMDEINRLAGEVEIGLVVSCPQSAALLPGMLRHPADVYLKIDVGSHRTGFDPGSQAVIGQAMERLAQDEYLNIRGFVAHAGHTYQARSRKEILDAFSAGKKALLGLKERFSKDYPGLINSWGDTPSCWLSEDLAPMEELRPGNFVYFDTMQLDLGVCTRDQLAATVAAPVVALHPEREEVVVYAGAVHLSKEQGLTKEKGLSNEQCQTKEQGLITEQGLRKDGRVHFGRVVFYDTEGRIHWPAKDIFVDRLSQEHGILRMPRELIGELRLGDLLGIVPVHACLAADLLQETHVVRFAGD